MSHAHAKTRSVHRAVNVVAPSHQKGPFQIARPLAELGDDVDPFLMIDWAKGDKDPFGPHPHAGFSAVTWHLPQSSGKIRNRDSLGDDSLISPGEIHWFEAAHGAVHNETPIGTVELFQIFVNLPAAKKHEKARTYRGTVDSIPQVHVGKSLVRVVVGSFEGRTSSVVPRTPNVGILDVVVDGIVRIPVDKTHNAVVICTHGKVVINGSKHNVVQLAHDGDVVELEGQGSVVLLHGAPLREPIFAAGPFVMSNRADLYDAVDRYRSGAMGHVNPLRD